jgi:hypothetical protein
MQPGLRHKNLRKTFQYNVLAMAGAGRGCEVSSWQDLWPDLTIGEGFL